ncbi:hypothetical protein B5G16_10295 [Alistipes sp. An66]|nr:hypothetical protein B5G16_10295 [Alistipes sp. An66]
MLVTLDLQGDGFGSLPGAVHGSAACCRGGGCDRGLQSRGCYYQRVFSFGQAVAVGDFVLRAGGQDEKQGGTAG